MPPRSSWKGFIKLSLVSVPVKAYTAGATGAEIRLNQLHKDCNNRIKYQKSCPEHGDVASDEIVSGYEYAKGQYVVIDSAEVQKLRPQGDQSIELHGFVEDDAINAMHLAGKNYYLVPDGPVGQKPYALLRQGMLDSGLHALAQVVLSGREQLVLLRPHDDGLLVLSVLNQDAKVKHSESFRDEVVDADLSKEELALTKTLIEASRIQNLDYAAYKDSYVEKLTKVIQAKVVGEEIVQVPDPAEPKIINLMEALKASVARAQAEDLDVAESAAVAKRKSAPSKKSAVAKKMAPSTKPKTAKTARRKKSG